MRRNLLLTISLLLLGGCTYDASPPGEDEINDSKPLLLIDATGLPARRLIRIVYTDVSGAPKTLATSSEKTDNDGRLLYPLYMLRGTRNYSVTITTDDSNDNQFGVGDKTTGARNGSFVADGETIILRLVAADFT
ncbi:MAG TPA: hypothetical protein PKM44_03320 [Turneriella sp.]|nr:hypothetical protein [Turneriella sp.]HMY10549.1 hypothetical protein [Turneriella sp.]HNA78564.1 hypothetical protein [Turneriella sp.]HNL09516.1 hypothetical protein [Turneriella sp.]HNL53133.1 hypothetical protein [Turneriella sp.]